MNIIKRHCLKRYSLATPLCGGRRKGLVTLLQKQTPPSSLVKGRGQTRKDLIETSILGHLFSYYSLVNLCKWIWWRNPQKFCPSKTTYTIFHFSIHLTTHSMIIYNCWQSETHKTRLWFKSSIPLMCAGVMPITDSDALSHLSSYFPLPPLYLVLWGFPLPCRTDVRA